MPITVRDRQYTISGDPAAGEVNPPVDGFSRAPLPTDIPAQTKRALGSWLSDATLGKTGQRASVRPVTDEAFVDTRLSDQPTRVPNASFSEIMPRSTSGDESLVRLTGDTLPSAPRSVSKYVEAVIARNSGSAIAPLPEQPKILSDGRDLTGRVRALGPALVSRAAGSDGAVPGSPVSLSAEKLFAARRALSAVDALGALAAIADSSVELTSPAGLTWGNMSEPAAQFTSVSSSALAAIAASIVTAAATAAAAGISALAGPARAAQPAPLQATGRMPLGTSTGSTAQSAIARALGVRKMKHDFALSVSAGLAAFFGLAPPGMEQLSALSAVIGGDAGFRIVVARAIVRSGTALASAAQAVSSADAAIALRSSAIIKLVALFAEIGDVSLTAIESDAEPQREPLIAVPRSAAAPSAYIIPDSLARESARVAGLGYASPGSKTKSVIVTSADRRARGARISTDDREALERELEAEYVPFYFHDVRTNEIISFHAFLTHLQDTFSPQWDSSEGFGRVEPVHTYKSTGRALALDFTVISTSPDDFDEMWVKLNKLVTLVYPQFDGGRWVQSDASGTDRFVQPFSQSFAASPLIRLRVGDVVRSNYSKFALQRLFGYGEEGLKLSGATVDYGSAADPAALSAAVQAATAQPNPSYSFYAAPGVYSAAATSAPAAAQAFDSASLRSSRSAAVYVVSRIGAAAVVCAVSANSDERDIPSSDTRAIAKLAGGTYVLPVSALRPTLSTLQKIERQLSGQTSAGSSGGSAELLNFFSEDSNAVVRSFREAGGLGLAGKIDSLSFNMLDRLSWETDKGRRAPIGVTVSVGFTVIHDVAPGLDRLGMNRAPVYKIGS